MNVFIINALEVKWKVSYNKQNEKKNFQIINFTINNSAFVSIKCKPNSLDPYAYPDVNNFRE